MHKIDGHVAVRRVEHILRRGGAGKFVAPRCAVIDRRHQCQHRRGVELQSACLLGQQVPGVLVDPVAQLIVIRGRAHFPGKRGGVEVLAQLFQRFFVVRIPVPQPDGVCKHAGHDPVVPAVLCPELCGLLLKQRQRLRAQRVQNLLPRLAVRHGGQHRKCHVDIQRRAYAVFLARVLHQGRNAGREPVRHGGRIGHIRGLFLIALPPCVPVVIVDLARILRHGNLHRCGQLCRRRFTGVFLRRRTIRRIRCI